MADVLFSQLPNEELLSIYVQAMHESAPLGKPPMFEGLFKMEDFSMMRDEILQRMKR